MQQMLLLLTEQVSRLASRVNSLSQTAQTAPAEELPARQTQMHLKVVQQELRPLLEQILHIVTTQMQPASEPLPAAAMLEAVQHALTPHPKGVAAAQQQQQVADAAKSYENSTRLMLEHFAEQQSAQQQQLVQQLVRRNPTSSASGAALRSSSHTFPANSSGGEYSALFDHCS